MIAGGYARDTKANRIPKDIDIIVTTGTYNEWSLTQLTEVQTFLKTLGHVKSELNYDDDCSEGAITMCFKLPESCIDIILFSKGYSTVLDVIDEFDCNMNQYYIDAVGVPHYAGAYPEGTLKFIDYPYGRHRPSRMNRMLVIAKEINW